MNETLSILIIEDNQGDQLLLEQFLSFCGIEIETVSKVETLGAAVQYLKAAKPGLIFLDLFLPDSSGIETFQSVNGLVPDVAIIVLSGLTDFDTAIKAIQSGAQDYLIKSEFDEKLLSKAITYSIERKKIQESLNSSLAMHELIGRATNDVIWDWNLVTNCIEPLSKSIETDFGYAINEIDHNLDWWCKKVHPADIETLQQKISHLIREGESNGSHEFRFRCANGEYRYVYGRALVLYKHAAQGKTAVRMLGVMQDVTDLEKAREKLTWSIERYETISKATSDVIFDWDVSNDKVVYWKEDIEKAFGYKDVDERPSAWWFEHLHPEDQAKMAGQIRRVFEEKQSQFSGEFRFLCADGTYRYMFGKAFCFYNRDQLPYRTLGSMQDITPIKALQKKVLREKMLRQQKITEATIQSQEREREELGRELHDNINQILATCKMFIDISIKDKDMREDLLPKTFSHLKMAIEELRKLSKSLVPPSLGDIGLEEALKELVNNANIEHKANYVFSREGIGELSLPSHLQLMIYRIVQEQLNNISKYAKASNVMVKLAYHEGDICVFISDDGLGFDTSKKAKGIGLKNIKSRTDLYGGKMKIVSSPGQGCSLSVCIPIQKN